MAQRTLEGADDGEERNLNHLAAQMDGTLEKVTDELAAEAASKLLAEGIEEQPGVPPEGRTGYEVREIGRYVLRADGAGVAPNIRTHRSMPQAQGMPQRLGRTSVRPFWAEWRRGPVNRGRFA